MAGVSELNFLVENPDLHIGHHLDMTAMNDVMNVVKEVIMLETVKDLDDELGKSYILKIKFSLIFLKILLDQIRYPIRIY